MAKTLIIAEKPSVANDIAKSLGGFARKDDYFESDDYVLTSAVGHLLEINAGEYEVSRGKWSFSHLPVIPPQFALSPIKKTESRLKLIHKLIRRKDIDTLVNACDAGREGELIFRLITQYAKARQPIKRLWLRSMTPAAIRDGFGKLRSDADMQPLASAARSRSEADWLIGINGTRALTAFNSKEGGFFLTNVGRVQTPTLSMVVKREKERRQFVSRDYWEVHATFACGSGTYDGRWFDPRFRKDERFPENRPERLWREADAQAIVSACEGKLAAATETSSPTTSLSPLLFDLTSLQREANARFGFSAKNTLAIAQALYDRHKVLTYPRTDSRHLPEDYLSTVKGVVSCLAGNSACAPYASQILKQGWIKPVKRVFDDKKISDHFAIIPTTEKQKALSDAEQKLYDLVVLRFLAVFFPAAEFLVTTRITEVSGHSFRSEGRVMTKAGWLTVYGKDALAEGDSEKGGKLLVPLTQGEKVRVGEVAARANATRPPARYTEATLLSAMESAGKQLSDDELSQAMDGKGLGTPATRAAIMDGLLTERYLLRDKRDLVPTPKAFQLMTLLQGLGIEELTLPELTAEWEYKLSLMEKGEISRDAFMQDIATMTQAIVKRAREYDEATVPVVDPVTLSEPCPQCGKRIRENYRRLACIGCDFSIPKAPSGRLFYKDEAETLLREHQIGPLDGFISKQGRPFSAKLRLVDDSEKKTFHLEFDFGQSAQQGEMEGAGQPDFAEKEAIGVCPQCGGNVYEMPQAYYCEKTWGRTADEAGSGAKKTGKGKNCQFRVGRVILQQEMSPDQVKKLLREGTTDLLTGFVSNRTRRPFKAYLVLKADGSTGFRFEEKKPKSAPPSGGGVKKADPPAERATSRSPSGRKGKRRGVT
ncbi:MAG: DNA topoisomerase III [Burkholderiaceae bacterium]|nr:DNA topoisomerase III [Burkholderiaceae bacterium]